MCLSLGRKAHLAQSDGAGGQADEAPFPAVGVLGQGELLGQGLDDVFDLHGIVLRHRLSHQPVERGEGLWDGLHQVALLWALWESKALSGKEKWAGSRTFPFQG